MHIMEPWYNLRPKKYDIQLHAINKVLQINCQADEFLGKPPFETTIFPKLL